MKAECTHTQQDFQSSAYLQTAAERVFAAAGLLSTNLTSLRLWSAWQNARQVSPGAGAHRFRVHAATQAPDQDTKQHTLSSPEVVPGWPEEACALIIVLPGAYMRPTDFSALLAATQVGRSLFTGSCSHEETSVPTFQSPCCSLPYVCRPAWRGVFAPGLLQCIQRGRRWI